MAAQAPSVEDLRALSLEDLLNVEITSVSKRAEPLSQAPAAIYVITRNDIRRSGAVSLPDVLRLAPNLEVARLNSQQYAISARGFNSVESSNKLLVMIDGRSIYTPLHAGVFWDQNQVMLEDIERIEVISGPGGTLWGANAVNGVINIITRHSRDTQGGLVSTQWGTEDQRGAMRYGGKLGEQGTYRVYAQDLERGPTTIDGDITVDSWDSEQGGFRVDWALPDNAFTVQGDIFDNSIDLGGRNRGHNLLSRWSHQLGGGSTLEVQAYYDTVERTLPGLLDSLETFDLQAQHSLKWSENHRVVWGGGYRVTSDKFVNAPPFVLQPEADTVQLGNVFAQDSITLDSDLTLTLGTKLEHNSLSGLEYLPSARIAWQLTPNHMVWSAVSRAVRTPSRIDRDLVAVGFTELASDFESEKLMAYEVGYRGRPAEDTSLSVSLFLDDYSDLRVLAVSPSTGLFVFDNKMEGQIYGMETWGDYRVRPWWRLSAGFTLMQKNLDLKPGAIQANLPQHTGNDPDHQFSLRSAMDLSDDVNFDVSLRSIDDLPNPVVPSYLELDARIAWQVTDRLELSLSGFNLLDDSHPEVGSAPFRFEIPRTVLAGARWKF